MHDKFEKEVQKKMEELRLAPSAPVWEKIELEIQPEKKRRRVFFWLLLGLMLGGGGFLAYQFTDRQQPVTEQASVASPNRSANPNHLNEKQTEPPHAAEVEKTTDQSIGVFVDRTKQTTQEQRKTIPAYTTQINEKTIKNRTTNHNLKTTAKENTKSIHQQIKPLDKSNSEPLITKHRPPSSETGNEVVKPGDHPEVIEKSKPADSLARAPEVKNEPPKAIDSSLKRKVAAKSGWKKQILVSGGWSDYRTFFTSGSGLMMDASAPSSVGSAAPVYYRPAETRGGPAFTVGFSFAKKLNEHFEVAFGLQYAHYSTQTKVGSSRRNDTTVRYSNSTLSIDAYYANAGTNSHTNRFHVAELPVTVSYKPSANLPLYVSVTAAYGRLLATNALTFSNRNNVYYENKEDYVRNMLPVSSSVQVELFSRKKVSMRIGPVVQYNLLKLQKVATEGERHLFFAGIKSTVNL